MSEIQLNNIPIPLINYVELIRNRKSPYYDIVQFLLKEMDKRGKNIGAICAAPFALNKAGVLKHSYTCYPSVEKQIREEGYLGETKMVVQDGNIMTSRGVGTALCFALEIVKKLKGETTYNDLKSGLLVDSCK